MIETPKRQLPTSDQWSSWKASPTTLWFFSALQKEFNDLTEGLILGDTLDKSSVESTALSTAVGLTQARVLHSIGNLTYEDVCFILDIEVGESEDE